MKRKMLSILLCAAMVGAALTGCGGSGGSEAAQEKSSAPAAESKASGTSETSQAESGAPEASGTAGSDVSGKVTFVSGNDQTGAVDAAIAAFNEVYPNITVDHQVLPGNSDDVKKSLMTSLAAGDSDPDVFECDIIWVSQFAAAGWLMDVTEDLEKISDQYLGGPLSTCYYGDKAYAYPNYTDVGLLYYRSDLIDTPPTTWDELVQMCKEHVGKNGIEVGYEFQMFQGEPTSCNMLEFIKQNGGTDLADGKFAMNNANTIEALEFVESMIKDGIATDGVLAHKPDDSRAVFEEGKALFMRNWTYAYANAQLETSKVAGNVGVAALPVGPNGTKSAGTLGGWDLAVNANSDDPEAAQIFAQFMSGFEVQKIYAMQRATFPTNSQVYDDAEVKAVLPHLEGVREAADKAEPRPQVRDYSAISSVFQVYFHKALTGELSNEEAMEQMDKELNDALAAQQ